ncbi:HD-GYP domain-containing protein [Thermosyntropha lipolytica]|nr:HD domain-containing phosphohydrolase [Thermosyntropha lipolytica]
MRVLKEKLKGLIKGSGADIGLIYAVYGDYAFRVLSLHDDRMPVEYNFSEFLHFDYNQDSVIWQVIDRKQMVINNEGKNFKPMVKGVRREIGIPVAYGGEVFAVVCLGRFKDEDIDVDLERLNQVVVEHILDIQRRFYQKLFYKSLLETMILIDEIFSEKSDFMPRHIYNVAAWAIEIAKRLKYADEDLTRIYLAAVMHDIGKIFIDKNILNKPGKLTAEEYNEMKKHAEIGYNIAKNMFLFELNARIPQWIYQHHEKWDGTGYPNGLKGEEIEREARILKVADALDAMLGERSYKKQKDIKEAISELRACRGKDFDPQIADIAVEILNERLNYSNKVLDDIFLPARLIMHTGKAEYSYEGYLSKEGEDMMFHSVKNIEEVESPLVINTLIIEKQNIIFEYRVKTKRIDANILKIYDIVEKTNELYFGLLWLLSGYIIKPDTKEAKEITITRISGNELVFICDDDYHPDEKKGMLIVIQFEDGTRVPVPGRITSKIKLNKVWHYYFAFTGITERNRDEILRQIFRKQINLKKFIYESSNKN